MKDVFIQEARPTIMDYEDSTAVDTPLFKDLPQLAYGPDVKSDLAEEVSGAATPTFTYTHELDASTPGMVPN